MSSSLSPSGAYLAQGNSLSATGVVLCDGCGAAKRCQLGIEREDLGDDGVLRVRASCALGRSGVRGVAHGGWIADVFDEVLGKQIQLRGLFAVTRSLEVRFRRPVPVGRPLLFTSWDVGPDDPRLHRVDGRVCLEGADDVLAEASAVFAARDEARHLSRFGTWMRATAQDEAGGDVPG